jgi:5-methylthioadenosine/S-adenosylhomocysteine deaminase
MAQKPTFVLHGRIVTMQAEENIIDDGYLAIKDGRIVTITDDKNKLPAEFAGKKIVETEGTIYPGLIDLHNHFVYNVLPLWVVPKRYDNRSQWPSHAEYKSGVSKPIKQALAKFSVSAKALVRYVETKALISGTTTGQGMRTQVKGGSKLFVGAMRFAEQPDDASLPPARSMVPDLVTTGATAAERIDGFRRALEDEDGGAYFYHLSEGIDERARKHFFNLKENDLINDKLVGIHSLGLHKEDLTHLAKKGAKVVWSPFSNQLLYGQTIDLKILKASKVLFSLGCDWSPSGSKNMLQELKVAYHANKEQEDVFSNYELIQAATSNAAAVTGWEEQVGTLEEGKLADILVISGTDDDAYLQLIKAVEKDVELVIVNGVARYGNISFMKALRTDTANKLEETTIGKKKKGLYLFCEGSAINDISFEAAVETLKDVMKDLPGFVTRMQEEKATLMELGVDQEEEFTVELDNEFEIESDVFQEYERPDDAELFADPPMADSVEFDTAVVEGDEYWARIDAQKNIPEGLKEWLKECYNQ